MKKTLSFLLAVLLLAAVGVNAFAVPVVKPVSQLAESETDRQIKLLFANLDSLAQDTDTEKWSYSVTDLDHNGFVELIAAVVRNQQNTYAKVFEVGENLDSIVECDMFVKEGEPFADILQDSADTYYDRANNRWHYLFTENYFETASDYYAVKCSVSLDRGYITPRSYAYEHCFSEDGNTVVEFYDMKERLLTLEEYNSVESEFFAGMEKTGTSFGWFKLAEAKDDSELARSYMIFAGSAKPSKANTLQIVSAPSEVYVPYGSYLIITKNPTSEYLSEGQTAQFVAYAENAASMIWSFVSPSGDLYSVRDFTDIFRQCSVSGETGPDLRVWNVNTSMSGWGAFCTFYNNGQTARSATAYLNVYGYVSPVIPSVQYGGVMNGTVTDFLMSSVTIYLNNGVTVQLSKDLISNNPVDLYIGSPCTVYYSGSVPTASSIYSVYIDPSYRSYITVVDPVYPLYDINGDPIQYPDPKAGQYTNPVITYPVYDIYGDPIQYPDPKAGQYTIIDNPTAGNVDLSNPTAGNVDLSNPTAGNIDLSNPTAGNVEVF